jgi:quercetin dioxygenase-like cupin family protein
MPEAIFAESAPHVPNNAGLDARRLHVTDHVEVIQISLGPGERLVRHAAPVDTFLYILEGAGAVETAAGRLPVSAGALVPNPARTMHRVINDSTGTLRFLVVKTPKPTSPPMMSETQD